MRIMHTMLRVRNLEAALSFYTGVLDMHLLRRQDYPDGRFSLAFLGYGTEVDSAVLELTWNWGTDHYGMGDAYGHIAIGVKDVYAACERIRERGGRIVREAGPMQGGSTVIAFIEDPDGYKIELLADPALARNRAG